jgi:hypothetical protein
MILHVLFAQLDNKSMPEAVSIVDQQTVDSSPYTLAEYLGFADEQAQKIFEANGSKVKTQGWFEIDMGYETLAGVQMSLEERTPVFRPLHVAPTPRPETNPSVPGITVTVGRTPGTIQDDEIFGE